MGFVPINRSYAPPPIGAGVTIYIRSNPVHTDLVLPVVSDDVDWRRLFPPADFPAHVSSCEYVAIGWGDRGFYVETPTWRDLKLSTALVALFLPSEAVLHVDYLPQVPISDDYRAVRVTREQYDEIVRFVRDSVAQTDSAGHSVTATERTYGARNRFYLATGKYHLFNNCNQWTGRGLARGGVPTGLWTPLKDQVLFWLPLDSAGVAAE